jgi:hypothetical protein
VQSKAPTPKLKEDAVKQALKTLAWDEFKQHLSVIDLDDDTMTELLGHIRRSSDFLMKRYDERRESARSAFLLQLGKFLEDHVGAGAAAALGDEIAVIRRIEAGYREILRTQESTVAAKLLPEIQAAAALSRSTYAYHTLMEDSLSSILQRKELTLQSLRIKRPDGSSYSPDGVLTSIVDVATMTLLLLGHRHKWFDTEKFLVLPKPPSVTEDEIFKAGLTEVLAASWRHWERMEQRCRYFGGDLKVFTGDDLPGWATAEGAETVIEYHHIPDIQFFDYIANERLNDRLIQTFQEMALETNMEARGSGIAAPLSLPPGAFVSAQEAHSNVSLSEILGYDIVDDQERPCGLRLVEWIRGYATLQCLADERYAQDGRPGLCTTVLRNDLVALLDRVGLKGGAADTFVDQASIRSSSRDLFDQPLIRIQDGSLLLFGPGILNADPARVALSAISKQAQQLGRKGKAFERETLRFFQEQGFEAKACKFKRDGEEFEYDVIVPWEDYVFIFECKNYTLSGHNPVSAFYFVLGMASAVEQVKRQADALSEHANVVLERTGIDITNKTVVSCILNSLPYALKGDQDGVYITDASSLKRFFQHRNFHIIRPHDLKGKVKVLHRTAMKALWKGDKPTPADLLLYLSDPLQLQLMIGHAKRIEHRFGLGERTAVSVVDLEHDEIIPTSVARLFSVDERWVEREAQSVARAIRDAVRKREERSVRDADRAWRTRGKLTPTQPR